MPSRCWVYWSSLVLALAGWGGTLWSWLDHGHAAGVNPGFIVALAVGTTFSVIWSMCVVLPDVARVYGIGHREGFAAGESGSAEKKSHLRLIKGHAGS